MGYVMYKVKYKVPPSVCEPVVSSDSEVKMKLSLLITMGGKRRLHNLPGIVLGGLSPDPETYT